MRRVSFDQNPEWLVMASELLRVKFRPEESAWISSIDGRELLAVTVFTRFSPHNCEMSIASWSPRWCFRQYLDLCFGYAFRQCKLSRVSVVCEEDNDKSRDMVQRLGWKEEARLSRWFGRKDGILYRMLRDECQWIGVENVRMAA